MVANRGAARAERRAVAIANLQRSGATVGTAAAAEAPKQETAAAETKPAKPAEPPKATEPAPEAKDPAAERGLAQIEQAKKRWLDERASKEEEMSRREARVAQRELAAEEKLSSAVDPETFDVDAWLDRAKLTDGQLALLSRSSYYRTAEGQKKPEAKQAVDDYRQRTSMASIEERFADLEKSFDERVEKRAQEIAWKVHQQASYANEWTDGALKEVPTDKPSFFAKLHAKDPRDARRALQAIGGELEKSSGSTPSAAEVLAEFEKRQRSYLESVGLDPDVVLSPPKPAPPAPAPTPKPTRTLDVAAATITRPENAPKTRDEKRATAIANLRARQRATADQT
jgi:hypothetical protein